MQLTEMSEGSQCFIPLCIKLAFDGLYQKQYQWMKKSKNILKMNFYIKGFFINDLVLAFFSLTPPKNTLLTFFKMFFGYIYSFWSSSDSDSDEIFLFLPNPNISSWVYLFDISIYFSILWNSFSLSILALRFKRGFCK